MLTLPNYFSVERSIYTGHATLWSGTTPDQMHAIEPFAIRSRGTVGYASEAQDLASSIQNANPSLVEWAYTKPEDRYVEIRFTLSAGEALAGISMNSKSYFEAMKSFVDSFSNAGGFRKLAELYLVNVANMRWAWRNRSFASSRQVTVKTSDGEVYTADASRFSLTDMEAGVALLADMGWTPLVDRLAKAFQSEPVLVLSISGLIDKGAEGPHEVWPSQLWIDQKEMREGDPTKQLFSIGSDEADRHAAMTTWKIGNAIRTIDIWTASPRPLAIDAYAVDTRLFEAYRKPADKRDFYSIAPRINDLAASLAGSRDAFNDAAYLVACLIRGGVYTTAKNTGEGDGKKAKKTKKGKADVTEEGADA